MVKSLYSKEVFEHFKHPRNLGKIKNPDAVGEAGNLLCGDVMRIYLKIKNNRIVDVKGEVLGCLVAIANTSMLTTMVKGKTLKEALKIRKEDLIKKLGGPEKVPPFKLHCSILALDALHEAIYNYLKQRKLPIPKELKERHLAIQKTLKIIEQRHKEFIEFEKNLFDESTQKIH
ncbi:MAG: iron-sulfur cluster assembly scaffold protein [Candidatus Nanoarchaeia archaeon]|nr:iron-sulfur cluster assembly scaffold protein [Candidatus Haiyanarchaeum thermophilum]MCW1303361.1 iron-sulfur cluster assembly scaffold protein [Candidatus Haiyanarchaeum thermophilum]MCW1303951.1 iron-sulfur cluster assembly scaffold protein [Candidatus Haiyanarchaeum thermophilum]MCW1306722.1 iron-sulfur cluster assembly scaffold protein [Candidatus Haiyanarchaeum thermophilum]MCW1307561.1 iron-sulfur cluster assembly scaffold protein [Candidatus Haiyanarchaeum thermophilum]